MTVTAQQWRLGDRVSLTVLQGRTYTGIVDRVSRDGAVLRVHTDAGHNFSVRADSTLVRKSAP